MEYVGKYLNQIAQEDSDVYNIEVNTSDGSYIFKSDFEGETLTYNIEKEMFFNVCKDAKNEEEIENLIDNLIVHKYCEEILELMR